MLSNNNTDKRHNPIDMAISETGILAIMHREGLRLHAYDDSGGTRTIGYGHTFGVRAGEYITQDKARELLMSDISHVAVCIFAHVTVPLRQCEFDALISFVYNIGCEAFQRSQVLAWLNKSCYRDAAMHMTSWHKVDGKVSKGLWNRRKEEVRQFLDDPKAI